MVFRVSSLALWLFLLPLLTLHQPALGADATSFDPTQVAVKAKGAGGVPVGTIISWPVATDPEDMDNWLECNGQSISQSVYPELFAVLGGNVPDLRGLFLRGHGSQTHQVAGFAMVKHSSAGLGQIQGHAILEHGHRTSRGNWTGDYRPYYQGAGNSQGEINTYGVSGAPTDTENRPVNTAVRYLIRARP